jgi:hypothetical protein
MQKKYIFAFFAILISFFYFLKTIIDFKIILYYITLLIYNLLFNIAKTRIYQTKPDDSIAKF